jgi:hypothetical protein
LATTALLVGVALSSPACSTDSAAPPPTGNGDIPPPLNQPCDADSDCESFGLKCDPLRGCLSCVFDWHCDKGERCTDDGCKVPATCKADSECSDPKAPHCDPVISECVGCRGEADCPEKSHCVERSCVSYTPCVNSRDCAEGTVCNRDAGECVECLGNGDCEKDKEVCVATRCVPVCSSDKDCLGRNQLCHHDKGYCADCVEQEDCPGVYYCDQDLCKLDVCKPGDTMCAGSSSYGVCNAVGSGFDTLTCPISTTCSAEGGSAGCKPWICTPGTSDCDAAGQVVKQCAQDGLSFASEIDCAADGQLCHLAQCKPKVCEPGSVFCQGSDVHECAANGTASSLKVSCGFNQYCDEQSGTCEYQSCTPGAALCDGGVATKCDAKGAGPEPDGIDCAEDDKLCYDGECRDVVCDKAFCKDGNAYACMEQGTVTSLKDTCNASEYCLDGYCHSDRCSAGQAVCDAEVATTCAADGSGFESGGTDCAAGGKVCENGACVAKVCEPDTYYCANGNPNLCNDKGTGSSRQYAVCSSNSFCKTGYSYCLSDVCTQGQKMCDGNVATTCNTEGSGPAAGGTDCAKDDKVCHQGTCLPKICNPNEYFCQGGNSYTCGSTGATSTLNDTCAASEYCKPGTYLCQSDACAAGTPTCNGDNLSTCAADGSGPVDAGQSCGAGKTCFGGACKSVVCTPDAFRCSGGNVERCTEKGTTWSPYQTCSAATYCNELATPITCSPDICTPSANACNGEKLATCDADGGHFSANSTNCAATGKVCTLAHTCLAVAEDTVGDTTTSTTLSSYLVGNVYRSDRARSLTEIEQYFSVSGTSVFTWVVYEADSSVGYFKKIYETTTSNSGMGAFISSGAIDVSLQAGKYYLIGAVVQGSFTRYYVSSAVQPFVSFGQLVGAHQASGGTPPLESYVSGAGSIRYNQRLSTAAP